MKKGGPESIGDFKRSGASLKWIDNNRVTQ